MKIKLIIFLSLFISFCAFGATKAVLATDTNHDGELSTTTVKNSEDMILVKANPPVLSPQDVVLQTKGYNLYTAATLEDLKNPGATRKIFFAKLLPNNFIKTYTLANVGYSSIEVIKNDKGEDEVFLVTFRNSKDKVQAVQIEAPTMQVYQPNVKKNKPFKGR